MPVEATEPGYHPVVTPSRGLRAVLLATWFMAALLVPLASPAVACATAHGLAYLTDFPGAPSVGSLFYVGPEGGVAQATIGVTPGCSDGTPPVPHVHVNYVTEPGSATSPGDYTEMDGSTAELCNDIHGTCPTTQEQVTIQMGASGDVPEPALESFQFRLTGTTPTETSPGITPPFLAPVYVVDTDGSTRASLQPGVTYSRSETFPMIRIPVFLAGPSPGSVRYTLTPDPAAPATPGQDFNDLTGGVVSIGPGRVGFIDLGIVNDELGEGPESVGVTLTGPVDGSGSTSFTILDNEENEFPVSRFHHPREGWRYKKSDYRIREFHVFTSDNPGGSGVVAAEIALRKNMKNRDCLWLTPEGWQKKDCSNRQWLGTTYDDVGQLFRLPMKQLKSSVKTKIMDYTAYSRAIDGAGNVENQFDKRRNANTFEIKRTKRKR